MCYSFIYFIILPSINIFWNISILLLTPLYSTMALWRFPVATRTYCSSTHLGKILIPFGHLPSSYSAPDSNIIFSRTLRPAVVAGCCSVAAVPEWRPVMRVRAVKTKRSLFPDKWTGCRGPGGIYVWAESACRPRRAEHCNDYYYFVETL